MTDTLAGLIDKVDNAEVIRDQIALILATETLNQVALATAAAKPDPTLWAWRTFTERSEPWELFLKQPEAGFTDRRPIVNVSYDGGAFDRSRSDMHERQVLAGVFNVDVIALGVAKDVTAGGQRTGDEEAVHNAERIARLIRNTLMSALNIKLQLPDIVWDRWSGTVTPFKPEFRGDSALQVAATRAVYEVAFNELSPQFTGEPLEYIAVDVKRDSDGMIVIEADFDLAP